MALPSWNFISLHVEIFLDVYFCRQSLNSSGIQAPPIFGFTVFSTPFLPKVAAKLAAVTFQPTGNKAITCIYLISTTLAIT